MKSILKKGVTGRMRSENKTVGLDVLFICILGAMAVGLGQWLLPQKYYYDGLAIQVRLASINEFMTNDDVGFSRVSDFYGFMGVTDKTPFFIQCLIGSAWACLALCFSLKCMGLYKPVKWWLLISPLGFSYFIYMGQLSKEHFALMSIVLLLLPFLSARVALILCAAAILAYALVLRPYWGLVLVFWAVLLVLQRKPGIFNWKIIPCIVVSIYLVSLAVFHFRGFYLSDLRFDINVNREGSDDAKTIVSNLFIAENSFYDTLNIIWGYLTLSFPLYLIPILGVQHVLFGFFGTFLTVCVFRAGALLWRVPPSDEILRLRYVFLLWLAFSLVQGAFEPDYGSCLKHQAAFFPAVASLLWVWSINGKGNVWRDVGRAVKAVHRGRGADGNVMPVK